VITRIQYIKATVSVVFIFLCCFAAPVGIAAETQSSSADPFRGMWVVRDQLTSRESIDTVVNYAVEQGFNQLIIQVRGRGDAYYQSEIVPRATTISEPQLDPLGYAIRRSHEMGLTVHAWINTYLLWTSPNLPEQEQHLMYSNPEWTDSDYQGIRNLDTDWTLSPYGTGGGVYLSPTHPEVNPYLIEVAREILERYNVDGIHLDYVRYQGSQFGYNELGRSIFFARYGIDPLHIGLDLNNPKTQWRRQTYETYLNAWTRYRQRQVTTLVREIKSLCDARDVLLSAAVKPDPVQARRVFFQDWAIWLKEDLLHFAIPMNYLPEEEIFLNNIQSILQEVDPGNVVMGIALYNQTAEDAAEKFTFTSEENFKGVCFFSYKTLKNNPEYVNELKPYTTLPN